MKGYLKSPVAGLQSKIYICPRDSLERQISALAWLLIAYFFKLSRISLNKIISSGVGGAGGASIERTLLTTLTI